METNLISGLLNSLDMDYARSLENDCLEDMDKCLNFQKNRRMVGWEIFFCPEKKENYHIFLKNLSEEDVVFDIGAGDLRFDLIMSQKIKKIYAIEINPTILGRALQVVGYDLPENIIAICADAFQMDLPLDATVITCLMRHRQHPFRLAWRGSKIIYLNNKGKTEIINAI